MTARGIVKVLVAMYFNSMRVKYAPVKDVAKMVNATVGDVDAYRIVYGLGLKDPKYTIERDESTTYIRVV